MVWLGYRLFFKNSEFIEEVILKPIIFIGPVLLYLQKYETVSKETLGLRTLSWKQFLLWGGLFSLFLASENIVVSLTRGVAIDVTRYTTSFIGVNLLISFATGISEEVLYRGFLMERIWNVTKNEVVANIGSTFLFMFGHVGVALFQFHYRGWDLTTYLLLMFAIGSTQGFIYGRTRSIYASTLAHTIWNFVSTLTR